MRPVVYTHADAELRATMPTLFGYVIHPDYVPDHHRAGYLKAWGAWCRTQPRHAWPSWIADVVERERAKRQQRAAA